MRPSRLPFSGISVRNLAVLNLAGYPVSLQRCWVRLYDREGFRGDRLTLLGPINMPAMIGPFGTDWENEVRSLQTGPKANVTVFDNRYFFDQSKFIGPTFRTACSHGSRNARAGRGDYRNPPSVLGLVRRVPGRKWVATSLRGAGNEVQLCLLSLAIS